MAILLSLRVQLQDFIYHIYFYHIGQSLITRSYLGASEAGKWSHILDDSVTNWKSYYCVKRNNRIVRDNLCYGPPLCSSNDPGTPFFTYIEHVHPLTRKGNPKISCSILMLFKVQKFWSMSSSLHHIYMWFLLVWQPIKYNTSYLPPPPNTHNIQWWDRNIITALKKSCLYNCSKKVKYFGINVTKYVYNLYAENDMLVIEIKGDLKK